MPLDEDDDLEDAVAALTAVRARQAAADDPDAELASRLAPAPAVAPKPAAPKTAGAAAAKPTPVAPRGTTAPPRRDGVQPNASASPVVLEDYVDPGPRAPTVGEDVWDRFATPAPPPKPTEFTTGQRMVRAVLQPTVAAADRVVSAGADYVKQYGVGPSSIGLALRDRPPTAAPVADPLLETAMERAAATTQARVNAPAPPAPPPAPAGPAAPDIAAAKQGLIERNMLTPALADELAQKDPQWLLDTFAALQ